MPDGPTRDVYGEVYTSPYTRIIWLLGIKRDAPFPGISARSNAAHPRGQGIEIRRRIELLAAGVKLHPQSTRRPTPQSEWVKIRSSNVRQVDNG